MSDRVSSGTGPEGSGVFSGGEFKSEVKGAKLADLRALGTDWQALVMSLGEAKPADPALIERLKGYVGVIDSLATHVDLSGMSFKDTAGAETFSHRVSVTALTISPSDAASAIVFR